MFPTEMDVAPGGAEEIVADMHNEPSIHECFLGKEMLLSWVQTLEQAPLLDLWSAQLQFLWYGLR